MGTLIPVILRRDNMYRYTQVLAVLFASLTLSHGFNLNLGHLSRGQVTGPDPNGRVQMPSSLKADVNLCPLCIQFTGQAINQLLNIILNAGVVGTCGTLCSALAQKTGSQLLGEVCTILCDVEGVEEFVKLIQKADLDPIYFCELLKTCPIVDNGDAVITSLSVSPKSGPQGQKIIYVSYKSTNGTGTGEMVVEVKTVDGIPVGDSFLQEPKAAGMYNQTIKLTAQPNPDCDPTQGPCERWLPGNYTVAVEICNGECGSKHPHSQVYDSKETIFSITEN